MLLRCVLNQPANRDAPFNQTAGSWCTLQSVCGCLTRASVAPYGSDSITPQVVRLERAERIPGRVRTDRTGQPRRQLQSCSVTVQSRVFVEACVPQVWWVEPSWCVAAECPAVWCSTATCSSSTATWSSSFLSCPTGSKRACVHVQVHV